MHAVLRARERGRADVRHHRRQHHADRDALRRHLLAPISSPSFTGSYVAPMALINAITLACTHLQPKRALAILRRTEEDYRSGERWYQEPLRAAASERGRTNAARNGNRPRQRQRPERLKSNVVEPRVETAMSRTASITFARAALVIVASLVLADAAPAQGTRLLRRPAVSRELVAFEYGGDLWTVPRSGGQARRLTSTPSAEIDPWFSPDGTRLAFTATVGGNTDVYVVPVTGGEPTRLTFHPSLDAARGWSPDGQPRAVRVDARDRAGPRPALDLQALVRGRSRPRARSARFRKCCRCHARSPGAIHRMGAASPTKRSASGSRPTGRRTRAACGGTIAAGARARSG